MSERFELPDDHSLNVAEQLFDALVVEASLSGSEDRDGAGGRLYSGVFTSTRPSFRRLYLYATDAWSGDAELEAALSSNPLLRADLRRLTAKVANYRIPELAAAASGLVTQRVAPGCRIRFEPSRAEPAQTYVIISLDDLGRHPRWLAVFADDDRCRRLALPEPRDGLIQLLVESNSDILAALRNPKSEIFIDG